MTTETPTAPVGRKPKGAGPERRVEILGHAMRLFSEFGVHTVSTRQIAAAVGISQPSLYAYFPTKQALVEEVCESAFALLKARMQAALAAPMGPDHMADMARVYVDFGLSEPDAYRVAFMIEDSIEKHRDGPNGVLSAGLGVFAIHRDAIAAEWGAGLGETEIDVLAQSLWASLHGLVSLLIARPTFPWADRETLIDFHIQRLFPKA